MTEMDPHYKELRLRVLAALPGPHDERVAYTYTLLSPLSVPFCVVKAILQDLRHSGLALCCVAVDPDEFTPRGSGYLRTQAGEDFLREALIEAAA